MGTRDEGKQSKASSGARSRPPRPKRSTPPADDPDEDTLRIDPSDGATDHQHGHDLGEDITEVSMSLHMHQSATAAHPVVQATAPAEREPDQDDPVLPTQTAAGPVSSYGRRVRDDVPPTAFDELALEMEGARSQFRNDWHAALTPDRVVLVSAAMMLAGCFLPWLTFPDGSTRLGISMAGVCHLLLSVQAFRRLKSDDWGGREFHAADRRRRRRRGGLQLVLFGALSVLVAVLFLFYWGYQRTGSFPVVIRFGVYWTLAWGTGLSYGGLSRFAGAEQ